MKMIKVTTAGAVSEIDIPGHFENMGREIGAKYIERVRIQTDYQALQGYVMAVDEEGLLAEIPVCNPLASLLYGTANHGAPIMGNVLILGEGMTRDGPGFKDLGDKRFNAALATIKGINEFVQTQDAGKAFHDKYDGNTIKDFPPRVFTQQADGRWTEENK